MRKLIVQCAYSHHFTSIGNPGTGSPHPGSHLGDTVQMLKLKFHYADSRLPLNFPVRASFGEVDVMKFGLKGTVFRVTPATNP